MSEHTRRTKRFNREHRKRSKLGQAVDFIQKVLGRATTTGQPTDGVWRFHTVASCAEDYKSTPPVFKIRPIPSDDELAQMDHG